jgi:cysteine desulfurase
MQIYLDYSATTPPHPEVIALMQQVMAAQWGNPSSLHDWGNRSATILERARTQVAQLINAAPESIVFTSGGTESNNLAILGVAATFAQPAHLIISTIEHAAISEPAKMLEAQGWEVGLIPPIYKPHSNRIPPWFQSSGAKAKSVPCNRSPN